MIPERWLPLAWLPYDQRCDFCWRTIPARRPRDREVRRTLVAWWSLDRNVHECPGCRAEGFRAERAREAIDAEHAAAVARVVAAVTEGA